MATNKSIQTGAQAYQVNDPDFNLSPSTGMTRQHYVDCAKYVLERAFKHVKSFDSPIVFPLSARQVVSAAK